MFSLGEIMLLLIMAGRTRFCADPGVTTGAGTGQRGKSSLREKIWLAVVLKVIAGLQGSVIVIVVTAGSVAGVVGEIPVRREVLQGHLMTMSTVVRRDRDGHLTGDLLVVLPVAGDAVQCVDLLREDRILRVLKLPHWVGVRKF